ncbi:MAG: tRNA (5-methylaminomethyl-2-thiouridine)(34)-methyltransferase MnmD [Bacteroidota bacterium]|nr:tRNA (5-methylaminomethyl-2-thiouridine)(34)-methyltransferase MnmD [Bacteroidota bacterium]
MYKNIQIIKTEDGSHTLYVPELGEHYHSIHGAVQESLHIFINAGLRYLNNNSNKINILEIGFGTGLNALLTFMESEKNNQEINYTSIEAFPLEEEIYQKINYSGLFQDKNISTAFLKMHRVGWNKFENITKKFALKKIHQKIEDVIFPKKEYNLVYFDAFAPNVQPNLWIEDIFIKIAKSMKKNGILTTYSAKGKVKRALKTSGFTVENIPGPPGKREITRAILKNKFKI